VYHLNQDAPSVRSETSSGTIAFYRHEILQRAGIFVRNEPPPKQIQSQMNTILRRRISEQRKLELADIADDISQKFIHNPRGANREDDLVELVCEALRSMHRGGTFYFPRKAGTSFVFVPAGEYRANLFPDWDPSLKPNVQQYLFDLDVQHQSNNVADDDIERPSKRQEADPVYLSPSTSQSAMLPPAPQAQPKQEIIVKNPRPDFTIGFSHSKVTDELTARGLSNIKADQFLRYLQQERILCSNPTLNFLDVRFPILVIEGKS